VGERWLGSHRGTGLKSYQLCRHSVKSATSAFMVVGALIVAHRPSNAIGWIFAAIGLLAATALPAGEYTTYV
jgi:hypothetical protein